MIESESWQALVLLREPVIGFYIYMAVLISVAALSFFLPAFQARRKIEKILKDKGPHDPRVLENPNYGIVGEDAEYLRMRNDKGESSELRWIDVEEVHAFKKDLVTTDLICVAFKQVGTEEYCEIHEEMAGYHDLLEVLPSRLANFKPGWIFDVAFPAFATNHKIIWKRSMATHDAAAPPES